MNPGTRPHALAHHAVAVRASPDSLDAGAVAGTALAKDPGAGPRAVALHADTVGRTTHALHAGGAAALGAEVVRPGATSRGVRPATTWARCRAQDVRRRSTPTSTRAARLPLTVS